MPDDLLDRARMLPADPVIDELIAEVERLREQIKEERGVQNSLAKMAGDRKAEIERLRPLAELWERLEALFVAHEATPLWAWPNPDGDTAVDFDPEGKHFEAKGATLPEAVRALLEEVERGE